ncbi:DUF2167 domain-containing protein [Pseudomonas sp. CCI3.2]|uniref:DUF2167 domain-containing protein n=1 Tax=unclassified Pseudomonas TaxID=196821 RepID=UPI002AC95F8F|nr:MULTISPECIES: DUF2167 domain-containing protein [unclassified Pseudomonas]MEB0078779.1 DUF2167 domain-containing protein [Pseudomonas sp. MH10out]MEB0093747.1 DUF2167 domain-containing protein [Pseudomonas sp. CCI4.2]MEB0103036.1 DUF2167 domain-containing protein [Pseudomonas sp. CCI3.2]MEB0129529.1 DUF2167 domain-containing protein [Pseudomonas sp. CCI2.4]MEB0157349.1 DUF2167 domain-containing protein [Pseudomonas sp. AH2 (2023)]
MKCLRCLLAAIVLCATTALADAATPTPHDPAKVQQTPAQFFATLKPQHGTINLPGGVATLSLNDDFYYLTPQDTERLIVDGWGNPPGHKTLGMIVPHATNPMSRGGWGVLVSYKDDGHVSDEDAAQIDYTEMLKQMQEDDVENNNERRKQGYPGLQLVGWAEPPRYDDQSHKMYWARELKADNADENTLNYSIRVLGRQGVLELNAVASMSDLATIQREMPHVLAFTNFTDGNRYADYEPGTDKLAKYGLAALVAGGLAAKAGLFAKLGIMLLAAKKFLLVGLMVAVTFVRKFFNRNK